MRFIIAAAVLAASPAAALERTLANEEGCFHMLSMAAQAASTADAVAERWSERAAEAPNASPEAVAALIDAAQEEARARRNMAAALMAICQTYGS